MRYSELERGWKIALWVIIGLAALGWLSIINETIDTANEPDDCAAIACDRTPGYSGYCSYHEYGRYVQEKNEYSYSYSPETTAKSYEYTPDTNSSRDTTYYDNDWLFGEDYFDVDMYGNPEDFYDDYYDDFWDYEEAEEYYYSHGGQ